MADQINTSSHTRTSKRRQGVRLSKPERTIAQEKFLKAFANTGNVRAACLSAGVDRSAVRQWEEHDETFGLRYANAKLDVDDAVRGEIWRRAIQGVERPVVSMGKLVYEDGKPKTVREYSDTLLALLARSRMPEYREKQQVEMSGPNGTPLQSVEIYKVRLPDNGRDKA